MTPTYHNPVYAHDFADPFVLQYRGGFWAYCTGIQADGRCFGILHSCDLVHWEAVGSAMDQLPGGHSCYWAPEVSYHNGRFYLYYSVGNETHMQVRVAVASHPAGPFRDSGHRLTYEPFAIDPHVFQDADGTRYLFYATDFLERDRVGTGTVRDRMLDPYTLAGDPKPVTLAAYDWQIYDPTRKEKGGVRWHTVEGPFVLRHKGRYYQMFSGGNWQNPSYGVSYATTDDPTRDEEWDQVADGEQVLPLLRSIPGEVVGPGHNSVVRGPDNRQYFCIYHRWADDHRGRLLAIDRLEWVGEQLQVLGPTNSPQAVPLPPTFVDRFDTAQAVALGPSWACTGGQWSSGDGVAVQTDATGRAVARCRFAAPAFVAEVSTWALGSGEHDAAFGLELQGLGGALFRLGVSPAGRLSLSWQSDADHHTQEIALPHDFDVTAEHGIRLEVDKGRLHLTLADTALDWRGVVPPAPDYQLTLFTEGVAAAFGPLSVTVGWEETWEGEQPLAGRGWQTAQPEAWRIEQQRLCYAPVPGGSTLHRGPALAAYEWVVNARLDAPSEGGEAYALLPARGEAGDGPRLSVAPDDAGWVLRWQDEAGTGVFPLPAGFDPRESQHFRLRKDGGWLTLHCKTTFIARGRVSADPTGVGVVGYGSETTFDIIRVTAIPPDGAGKGKT